MATQNQNWSKGMRIEEMLPLMDDREIAKNARKGGVAAIAEQKRRRAPPAPRAAVAIIRNRRVDEQPGLFRTQAEIVGDRHGYADRILPDPELDIGV